MYDRVVPWPVVSSVMESAGYRRLLYSAAAVIFGVMGQAVARGWLARDLTGSNAGLGGVMLAFGIAMLLATPWGGVAADRFAKRTVLLVSVSLLVVSSLMIGLAVVLDVIEYWMLLVASAIQATAFALYLPARIAFIAGVVQAKDIGAAIVLSQTTQEAMRVIAPALAGVLIGLSWFGWAACSCCLPARVCWPAPSCSACRRLRGGRRRLGHRSPRCSTPSVTSAPAAASG